MNHYLSIFLEGRQPDNEICSVNRISRVIFSFKDHAEYEAARLFASFFLFFRKFLYEVRASGLQLSFDIFLDGPQLSI